MAKASMKLPDGTTVVIEGSVEEIQKILALRSNVTTEFKTEEIKKASARKPKHQDKLNEETDLIALVNAAKSSDEFGLIENNILNRSSQVDRILLPLYVAHKHISEKTSLTSGEISKFLAEFGVNIAQPNVAKTLSTIAVKYVKGDKLRKRGQAVRYRLSPPGDQYITAVIQGESNE